MKSFSRVALVALGLVALAGTALAQDPIAARKATMKKIGGSLAVLVKMNKGETPYDAASAKAAVEAIANDLKGVDANFPAGSDQGDTKAGAKIWEDMAGFKAALAKAEETSKGAVALAGKDADGLKAAIGAIGQSCSGCHNTYRKS